MVKQTYYSNGKLLITGEYVVLDGGIALAVPTKMGQSLSVETIIDNHIYWKSFDPKKAIWFENVFQIDTIKETALQSIAPNSTYNRLLQILIAAKTLNSSFLNTNQGFKVETHLDFPKNWGLGTSSTLINNIANWANINPFKLLKLTFGGSGYDVACANNNSPIKYQLKTGKIITTPVIFNPLFKDKIYFIHLNKKQNSRDGIAHLPF